jgi:hypothetical protein
MTPTPPALALQQDAGVDSLIGALRAKVEANPGDCAALETLRDALRQLGRREEAVELSYRLAEGYAGRGEFSLALLEYEALLRSEPADSRVLEALVGVERRMDRSRPGRESIRMDFEGVLEVEARTGGQGAGGEAGEDPAEDELAAFLIRSQLAPELVVKKVLSDIHRTQRKAVGRRLPVSLVLEVGRAVDLDREEVLGRMLDRTQMAYVPLSEYEVERSAARLIPEELAVGGLMVAFDRMSTTVFAAVANPFDRARMERAEAVLGGDVQWYLASPEAVIRVLGEVFRLPLTGGGAL